jgi:hypothetical protein
MVRAEVEVAAESDFADIDRIVEREVEALPADAVVYVEAGDGTMRRMTVADVIEANKRDEADLGHLTACLGLAPKAKA